MRKVLFIASTGGHLSEILKLDKVMKKYKSYLVTEKTDTTKELSVKYIKRIDYLLYCNKSHLSYIYKAPFNLIKSLIIFLKIKPDVIITTGAHTGVGMCYIGKLFRKKIIYIETLANIETKTLSGKLVYPIADLFIVQWESMLKLYPKAVLGGWLY
jgi:UDP-N-acetylglucosamine:LPS N-acetylglucosamine transferase